MKRKILYSPGFGAGWTSWCNNEDVKTFALTYQPIIDALERKEKLTEGHPVLVQFQKDLEEKFGPDTYFYTGGSQQLRVMKVEGRVRIEEYDGSESVEEEEGSYSGWM